MKTNKEIRLYRQLGLVVVPAGAPVEKNNDSSTGFFLSPLAFPENSLERHDATYYGFAVPAEDVDVND